MRKERRSISAQLAAMPPGPRLAAALACVDLSRLTGSDCVTVLRASHRQAAHDQARLMAAMVEVARCGIGPDDEPVRMDAPDEFSADEIRSALSWTRSAATSQLDLAWDLMHRLGLVFAALDAGSIDVPKARVFSEWTGGLTDDQAQQICDRLLPEAPTLTTGQLCERIKKMAIALDPDWARRRYEAAVRDRKVVGYRNDDGTGNVCGYQLPADQAAAACAHIDAIAKKIKHAGDGRPIDHIRADAYVRMLDGSYTGWSESAIIAHMLTEAQPAIAGVPADGRSDPATPAPATATVVTVTSGRATTTAPATAEHAAAVATRPVAGDSAGDSAEDLSNSGDGEPTASGPSIPRRQVAERHWPAQSPTTHAPGGPSSSEPVVPAVRRAGVEIRAEITMLLGLNQHPGEIAGWGFVHAEAARALVFDQTGAEWRYAITGDDGRLVDEGITRARPAGYPARADSPCRGGIVELHIKASDLRRLAARPAVLGGWAKVIADLARQADRHETRSDVEHRADRGRTPGKPMRRRTEIRDRTCTRPHCRAPAHGTDGDHIRAWAEGGPTSDDNVGSACRHDHRLKHEGGWTVMRLGHGRFVWISRLGIRYYVRAPLIIEPLPDPIPRDRPPPYGPPDDCGEEAPIWRELVESPTASLSATPSPCAVPEEPPF